MAATSIEWTSFSWNPTTGCDKVSPGCANCYALPMAGRLKAMGQPRYQRDGDPVSSGPGFGLTVHEDVLVRPRSWRKPRMVFVNSMSDLFHAQVPDEFIVAVFDMMAECDRHVFQLLTKRPQRAVRLASRLRWPSNVWMGVSVESQQFAFRVAHLAQLPAAVRFVSAEPLLGPLQLDLSAVDWLIAGGESGVGARACEVGWVRDLRDGCASAGVPFFFKQWGGVRKAAAGRLLDGVTHDAFPSCVRAPSRPVPLPFPAVRV